MNSKVKKIVSIIILIAVASGMFSAFVSADEIVEPDVSLEIGDEDYQAPGAAGSKNEETETEASDISETAELAEPDISETKAAETETSEAEAAEPGKAEVVTTDPETTESAEEVPDITVPETTDTESEVQDITIPEIADNEPEFPVDDNAVPDNYITVEEAAAEDAPGTEMSGNEVVKTDDTQLVYLGSTPPGSYYLNDGSADNDALFAQYVDSVMYGTELELFSIDAESLLTETDYKIFQILVKEIQKVAAGKRTNTEFVITLEDLGLEGNRWYAEDLGVESILDEDNFITYEADKAFHELVSECDLKKILKMLLFACPYELYWFDKTQSFEILDFGSYYDCDEINGERRPYLSG